MPGQSKNYLDIPVPWSVSPSQHSSIDSSSHSCFTWTRGKNPASGTLQICLSSGPFQSDFSVKLCKGLTTPPQAKHCLLLLFSAPFESVPLVSQDIRA